MTIRRKLFIVPLAENNHGKTTLVRKFVELAERSHYERLQKRHRTLWTPWGQEMDSYVFPRSFQEVEKTKHESAESALDANDSEWPHRDLIVMPSHLHAKDCERMINAGHAAGFDVIALRVLLDRHEVQDPRAKECGVLAWDERWTMNNERQEQWEWHVASLAGELWVAISSALFLH